MALLLRKIRHKRWFVATHDLDAPLPADPLADLNTNNNNLSLWEIFPDRSNLDDVLVGLAATFDHVSNIDLAIVDTTRLSSPVPQTQMTNGRTTYAKAASYHRDFLDLTAQQIIEFADCIRRHASLEGFSEREVAALLAQAIREGRLDLSDLRPDVQTHLQKKNLL